MRKQPPFLKSVVCTSAVVWISYAQAVPTPTKELMTARQMLKRELHAPAASETRNTSWLVRLAALKRSLPDRAGLALATRYLSDSALVVRLEAVNWIGAYMRAHGVAHALPQDTVHALGAQLRDQRNFRRSGEPIWVPNQALKLLNQVARTLEMKRANEWSALLQSLAQNSRSSAWKAQLTASLRSLPLKPRQ